MVEHSLDNSQYVRNNFLPVGPPLLKGTIDTLPTITPSGKRAPRGRKQAFAAVSPQSHFGLHPT